MIFFKPIYLGLIFLFIYSVFIFSYIKNNENYSLNNQNLFEFHNKKLLTLGNLDLNRFIIQNYNKKKIIITSYDYLTHIPYMHSKIILCRKKDCDSILTKYLTGDKNDAFLIFEEKFLPTNLNYFNLEIVDKYEGYIFFANKKIIN